MGRNEGKELERASLKISTLVGNHSKTLIIEQEKTRNSYCYFVNYCLLRRGKAFSSGAKFLSVLSSTFLKGVLKFVLNLKYNIVNASVD